MTLATATALLGMPPLSGPALLNDWGAPVVAASLRNRVVVVRVDYNIAALAPANHAHLPGQESDLLADDYRMRTSLPTLRLLIAAGARVVLLTHRGRPQGQPNPLLSTRPLARRLSQLLNQPVGHVPDCIGRGVEQAVADLPPGQVLMLENTRFHLGEQLNQPQFVRALARLGEVFVNEAFPSLHRAHASLSGLAAAMPTSLLGLRLQQELRWLQPHDTNGLTLLLGSGGEGAYARLNATGSFELLGRMLGRLENLMIGGVLANTFLAARDLEIGRSRYEPAFLEMARDFLAEAGVRGCRVLLPQDVRVAGGAVASEALLDPQVRPTNRIATHELIDDAGPRTSADWGARLRQSHASGRPVVWLDSLGLPGGARRADATLLQALQAPLETVQNPLLPPLLGGETLLPSLQQQGWTGSEETRAQTEVSCGGAVILAALAGQGLPALQVLQTRRSGGGWQGERRAG